MTIVININFFENNTLIFVLVTTYSIIVPSYNQHTFIKETLENLSRLKIQAQKKDLKIEIIVVDNCSDTATLNVIESYKPIIDILIVEKDKGQYDAINKGMRLIKGDYWTWLNTDDLIDSEGFFTLATYLQNNPNTDYIYGDIAYIDEHSHFHKNSSSGILSLDYLVHRDASISQPGSFFKTSFTNKIGELAAYQFAFDYEYILRCFKSKASVAKLNTNVAHFRYYSSSKSGSKDFRFLTEQLNINKEYGGKLFSKLSLILRLRILKRKLVN